MDVFKHLLWVLQDSRNCVFFEHDLGLGLVELVDTHHVTSTGFPLLILALLQDDGLCDYLAITNFVNYSIRSFRYVFRDAREQILGRFLLT
jgi:hypothetical protein